MQRRNIMSIVCCKILDDKIEVASDSITVRGSTQSRGQNAQYVKLLQVNNIIIGGIGLGEEISLIYIFCQTHQPKDATPDSILTFLAEFSEWKNDRIDNSSIENNYILIYQEKAFVIYNYQVVEITEYEAIGAGMDFALAALHLGHDVKSAVEIACELSIYCEKPVVYFSIPRNKND
jgi:ATP-dependent protease HslVU (ClpYQ) peptidase subunit